MNSLLLSMLARNSTNTYMVSQTAGHSSPFCKNHSLNLASPCLQRMILKLQHYNPNVIYKKGRELYVAGALSRSYLPFTEHAEVDEKYDVMTVEVVFLKSSDTKHWQTLYAVA